MVVSTSTWHTGSPASVIFGVKTWLSPLRTVSQLENRVNVGSISVCEYTEDDKHTAVTTDHPQCQ